MQENVCDAILHTIQWPRGTQRVTVWGNFLNVRNVGN